MAHQVTIPLQKTPRQIERPIAPIEEWGPKWVEACGGSTDWDKSAPPVRIHGNTYLVGTCGISAILITGSDGHILIDAGTEKGADLIAENIRCLGFKPGDVKILLHSHEHHRPCRRHGAAAAADRRAACRLGAGRRGLQDRRRRRRRPAGRHEPTLPRRPRRPQSSRTAKTVRLGNLALTAIATPGHTAGALSWHWGSCDGGVCRRIVYRRQPHRHQPRRLQVQRPSRDDRRLPRRFAPPRRRWSATSSSRPIRRRATCRTGWRARRRWRTARPAPTTRPPARSDLDERLAKEAAGK